MAGTRRFRRGNRSQAESRRAKKNAARDGARGEPVRAPYKEIERTNPNFITYYKKQKIVPEEEWSELMAALGRDLPTAFRISCFSASETKSMMNVIEGEFFKKLIEEGIGEEESIQKPFCLSWYPGRVCWQLHLTRKDIRRSENNFRLHNFLISETATGSISRQEVVSMIPPLLLDIQPHHKVLDLCAAPGSKTSQLIELMHSDEKQIPDGVVIGNDIDNSRCYMLVHQAKRLNSPCVIITNHDASVMPNFIVNNSDGSQEILKFDRVLCDVPCTGDGTLRKNADIWLKWNTANGNNLHGVQTRIIRRGVEMLTVGGRLVYSTCSFNPIEDEAVIHRLLAESEGAVQLIDVSSQLPGLKWTPGISHWYPSSRDMVMYNSYEEVPEKWQSQVSPALFPPSEEDASKYNLNRCLRILPHQQDTGGFFVAVLEKVRLLPWESSGKSKSNINNETAASSAQAAEGTDGSSSERIGNDSISRSSSSSENRQPHKRRKVVGYKEDPFVFFEEDEAVWPSIRDFFELDPRIHSGLLTRCCGGKKKNVYYVSPSVRKIAESKSDTIKLINTGVKAFVRCDNDKKGDGHCSFRLAQEGLPSISSFIGSKRRVRLTKDDMLVLLNNNDPQFPLETTLLGSEAQERVNTLEHGSCVLEYDGDCGLKFELVGWRGKRSLRAYISLSDCVHYLRLLGGDISKFEKNKFKTQSEKIDVENNEIEKFEESNEDFVEESNEVMSACG